MTNFTAAQLLAVIENIDTVFTSVDFYEFSQDPRQRVYPSIDIRVLNPQSNDATVQLIDKKTRFLISIYIKWSADRAQDTDNLNQLERNLLSAILGTTLNSGDLILEDNDFQQSNIQDNPFNVDGIQSTLTIYFLERSATVGIIGLDQSLDIGSITGLKLLGETGPHGRLDKERANDQGLTKTNKGITNYKKTFEYAYTKSNYDEINSLIEADNEISITLHEGAQGNTVLTIKPVMQESQVRFDGQKTVFLTVNVITDT